METTLTYPTTNSIDAFITTAMRFPSVTQEQEIELFTRYQQYNDVDAVKQLIMSHLKIVISIARSMIGYGLPVEDLIQEGNIGLMKSIKRFDPTKGVRLSAFAAYSIKNEIYEYIVKNWRNIKIATTKAQRKLFFNLRRIRSKFDEYQQSLTKEQAQNIATELNVELDDVLEMECRFLGHELSLDPPKKNKNDDYDAVINLVTPIDYLLDSNSDPVTIIDNLQTEFLHNTGLANGLNKLDTRSKKIIEARWLTETPSTLHDLSVEFNVSKERIRQIETKAMQDLRREFL